MQLRSLMLHMLNGMPALVLQSLHSEDVPSSGKVEVRADVLAMPGNQALLEQLVSRVSMERSVSVVRGVMLSDRSMEGTEV